MITVLVWVCIAAVVVLVILHDRRDKMRKRLAAEQEVRGTAYLWISELMGRGFSSREIAVNSGLSHDDVDAWYCGVGVVPTDADIGRLVEMALEARRAFILVHQSEIANRAFSHHG